MADEQQEQNEQIEPMNPAMADRPKIDWHLQGLVTMANEHGIEMGITLILGGTVITGQLISGKTYFESFAEEFANAWSEDDEIREKTRAAMATPAETHYGPGRISDPAGTSFIHLKKAKIQGPDGSSVIRGTLWRGRLTEVSGFFLGSVG